MYRRVWISVAMIVCMFCLLAAAVAAPSCGCSKGNQASYGPCCPFVTGQQSLSAAAPGGYWSNMGSFKGPERTCLTPKSVSIVYAGQVHRVDAVEVMGNVLVPQRVLAVTGADVEYQGNNQTAMALGSRKVLLTLGHHNVLVTDGDKNIPTSWTLCPRLRLGITYVPLRPAAEALGLAVAWTNGNIVLTIPPVVPTSISTAKCPADQMEEDLGVTLLRGPLNGPFGPGIGVLAVTDGGPAAKLGLQPRDVILSANGQRVHCPKDLQAAVSNAQGEVNVTSLTIARGKQRMSLGEAK